MTGIRGGLRLLGLATPLLLAACAGPYILYEYSSAGSKVVETRCGGKYRVTERSGRLLVSAYAASELYHGVCATTEPGATGLRYEHVATQYLAEANRAQCRITAGDELEPLHSEFTFECPAPPVAPPAQTPTRRG
ncbi:MAG TPA: hypothetical protein VIL09_07455 [Microvirga sp.]|jgi:hypothetical protein